VFGHWSLFIVLNRGNTSSATVPVYTRLKAADAPVVVLTVKSLNTRFLEPRRKAIRAALGWLTRAFCGLGGGGLLTAAGGDLHTHTHTEKMSVTIIYDNKLA